MTAKNENRLIASPSQRDRMILSLATSPEARKSFVTAMTVFGVAVLGCGALGATLLLIPEIAQAIK